MTATLQKTLDRNLPALIALAAEVQTFLTHCGASDRVHFKVQLAIEEVIRNLIEHGSGSASRRIDVRLDASPQSATLIVEDDGAPFDPRSAPEFDRSKPLKQREPRGMGIQLLRALMDEIHY
jgi:serine/threonine-protein kinase RsbW